jgi:hypothetical protein
MDLKKQKFKLTNLTTKLKTLDTQLSKLQNEKEQLLASQNTSPTQNNNLQLQLDELTSRKTTLLDTLKQIKTQITKLSRDKNILRLTLLDLPKHKQEELDAETVIQQEELDRIMHTTIEVNNDFISKIYNEYDNKIALEQEIGDLQSELSDQTNLLKNIQETVHTSRHNILNTLKQKKQDKLQYKSQLDQLLEKQNFISSKLTALQSEYNTLHQFKTQIINNYYSDSESLSIDTICIVGIEGIDNIDIFLQLSLNEKVQLLTDKLTRLDKLIKQHMQLLEKEISAYNLVVMQYNTKEKQSYAPKCELKTSNSSYKDIYKHEKQVKLQLETIVSQKTTHHINYNNTVIMQHVLDFKKEKDTLDSDTQRAIDRLNIMTIRINTNYASKETLIQSQIDDIDLKLSSFKQQMDNANQEIIMLDKNTKSQFSTILQLNELNQKIENTKNNMSQIQKDIDTISK